LIQNKTPITEIIYVINKELHEKTHYIKWMQDRIEVNIKMNSSLSWKRNSAANSIMKTVS